MVPEEEMARVRIEAQGHNVVINGWQEGTEGIPGFATVTDMATRTTFGVICGEPLAHALGRAQARMAGASCRSMSPMGSGTDQEL